MNTSPIIDLTISSTVRVTKLDLPKDKIVVNTPVHRPTIIQTEETELGCLGNNEGVVSTILTAQQTERVENGCQDNNQSNESPDLIKPKRRKKHKVHVCYRKSKAAKKPDAIKKEQAPEVAMPTNGKEPCQRKEESVPPRTESPCQTGPVNWTNRDTVKLSRLTTAI